MLNTVAKPTCKHGMDVRFCAVCNGVVRMVESVIHTKRRPKTEVKSHVWEEITIVDPDWQPDLNNHCIACNDVIEVVNSIYAKVLVDRIRKEFDGLRTIELPNNGSQIVEYKTKITLPVFKTGSVCRSCFDTLYQDKWIDYEGNEHRSAIPVDTPKRTTTEVTYSGSKHTVPLERPESTNTEVRHSNKSIGPTIHTRVYVDKDGEETEWIIAKPRVKPEPVDPHAHRHFTSSGSKHPVYCGCHRCKHKG